VASDAHDLVQPLITTAAFFAERGVFGLVWLDRELVVQRRYGSKVDFIAIGRPVTDSVMPFIGSEEEIASFQDDPSRSLELPGVAMMTSEAMQQRFNLSLFFDPAQGCYLLLVARASLDGTLELELLRHVRARLIAEADTTTKSKALTRANRDLEQFAAIVSHDLKAPMRALQFMADEAAAAVERADPAGLHAQLAAMREQAARMSSMLSGLLDYSTVGRKAMVIEMVDTARLVVAIAGSIPHGTGITVVVDGDWPTITTLRAPLDLVIRNLVDNAVKHHDLEVGRVVVGCRCDGADLVITVADDGPGIAPEHRSAIFLPFRTLEAPDRPAIGRSSAGLGLGLALVQRTVDSVGGRISILDADSPGAAELLVGTRATRGTTFEIRWPMEISAKVLLD
jgi:signal transduction histidine kinase